MSVAQAVRMKRQRCESKREFRYCYESPLKVFKKSLEELTSIVGDIVCKNDGRLTPEMREKLGKQNATDTSSRASSSRNSVIVINDSDSETTDGNNKNETNGRDEGDTSLSVIECISKPSLSIRQKRKSRISVEQNTNRSIISLDNDSSILDLSDMQESLLNGENIVILVSHLAPTQTEDDVVELWSCLKKSKDKEKAKCNLNDDDDDGINAMFTIDKRPNLKYLKCLETPTKAENAEKMKKKNLSKLKVYKNTHESFIKPIKQKIVKKCPNSNQRERLWQDNNLDSSQTKSNVHHNKKRIRLEKNNQTNSTHKLREIVVDGCNVAMAHTNGKEFSEKGINIVIDYFKSRGHVVKVFLPQHVRRKEHTFLEQLYKDGTVVFTPSRIIAGRQITSYDDRFILKYATSCGGVVISTDQYRDLYREKPEWRNTILNRLLIPTFVGDYIMFPEDPLGRFGPNLETFLRH